MTPQHPRFARAYARAVPVMNLRGGTEHRRSLLSGLRGCVIEVGAGEGSSFGLYPATVESVLAVEPDDYLRGLAAAKARLAAVPVTVVPGTAEDIPAADGEADAVVVSLVLCSVAEQAAVLAEIRRVLRPGGTLAFYEHVRSVKTLLAAVEDLLTPAWQHMAGGCHPNRNTLQAIAAAGFQVLHSKRFAFSAGPLSPSIAHILGRAISPREPR
ncbi:class I SAM-dependent methyltransferase [Arthrobacter sp. NA-172]|uniref:class I SAM-dependent methyltransferase n=1 Tax=Arthrobacter sp. NA-172 TaxID=3367524 RepID=UPI003754B11D